MIEHRVPARAALAGNPSDGYGGAVLSVPLPDLAATVRIIQATGTPATGTPPRGELELVRATRTRFEAAVASVGGVEVDVQTSIPRSVGLAGSSAIVIATIRGFAEHVGASLTEREIATLAHTVERVELAIPGGWQDQIIQSDRRGVPLLMEFAEPISTTAIAAAPIPLFVAYGAGGSQSSAIPHADLRSRAHEMTDVMGELAELGRRAAAALGNHDTHGLKEAINHTFDLRRTIKAIEPEHQSMIDTARQAGAACNFAGSGGAISGVVPKDAVEFRTTMESAGLKLLMWTAG